MNPIDPNTLTEDIIRALCVGCEQCIGNASTNLRIGYRNAAVSCVEYHLRGHRRPLPRYPNPKVDALIKGQISIDGTWTESDFAELAVAAADQAGMKPARQFSIAGMLDLPDSVVSGAGSPTPAPLTRPVKLCQHCGVELQPGPTASDYARWLRGVCGGEECVK